MTTSHSSVSGELRAQAIDRFVNRMPTVIDGEVFRKRQKPTQDALTRHAGAAPPEGMLVRSHKGFPPISIVRIPAIQNLTLSLQAQGRRLPRLSLSGAAGDRVIKMTLPSTHLGLYSAAGRKEVANG